MSLNSRKLSECLKTGGALYDQGVDARMLKRAAQESNLALFEVDCSRAKSKSAVLRAIANTVDFPEHFGGNLDALYDCLCDTVMDQKSGVVLVLHKLHSGDPALQEDAARIVSVCDDAAEFARENGRVFAYAVEHAGRHPEPEPGRAQSWSASGE